MAPVSRSIPPPPRRCCASQLPESRCERILFHSSWNLSVKFLAPTFLAIEGRKSVKLFANFVAFRPKFLWTSVRHVRAMMPVFQDLEGLTESSWPDVCRDVRSFSAESFLFGFLRSLRLFNELHLSKAKAWHVKNTVEQTAFAAVFLGGSEGPQVTKDPWPLYYETSPCAFTRRMSLVGPICKDDIGPWQMGPFPW